MTARETAEDVNQTACDWVARADRGLSDVESVELAAWLDGDPRRAGAYMRMTAVLVGLEANDATDEEQPLVLSGALLHPTRRRWLIGGALAASAVGAGLYLGTGRPKQFETRKGEKRVIALDDGSILTLNTSTRLAVLYTADQRLIQLSEGEALFDVAVDMERPFIVRAGGTDVRAVGTSFTVANILGKPVQVLVREGVVEVARANSGSRPPVRVAANTRAVVGSNDEATVVSTVEPAEIHRELSWQQGRLVFAGESLSFAAGQFARYSDLRIVVSDPSLAKSGVVGVFDANDPVGFAQAVALSLNARTVIREGEVVIHP